MKAIIKFLVLALALVLQPVFYLHGQDVTNDIVNAYELRMDGRTEEAQKILAKIIESNSKNAMAHYEMARTLENDAKNVHIENAVVYAPENRVYKFYQANLQMLEAYKGMKTNNTDVINKKLNLCTETLKSILAIKPDCKESLLFLVDVYGSLPKDMGGNTELAKTYLKTLKEVDNLYAAKGELILKSRDPDLDVVKHWKTYLDTYGESNEALINLGKAYLMTDNIDKAKDYFNKVIENDPEQVILHLDVARAYLYSAMRGGDKQNNALKKFKENINLYLDTEITKPKLIEAWCYGWLGMVESREGNKELADKYITKAEKLFPNYPRFTAIPTIDLPPNVMTYHYKSYFSPF